MKMSIHQTVWMKTGDVVLQAIFYLTSFLSHCLFISLPLPLSLHHISFLPPFPSFSVILNPSLPFSPLCFSNISLPLPPSLSFPQVSCSPICIFTSHPISRLILWFSFLFSSSLDSLHSLFLALVLTPSTSSTPPSPSLHSPFFSLSPFLHFSPFFLFLTLHSQPSCSSSLTLHPRASSFLYHPSSMLSLLPHSLPLLQICIYLFSLTCMAHHYLMFVMIIQSE